MNIVQAPDHVLSEQAKPIKKIDREILRLVEDMKLTLSHTIDPKGVGLAAPQVGKSLRLFIIKENDNAPYYVFINPTIKLLGKSKENDMPKKKHPKLEGCLSLKDIWGIVKRAPCVKAVYTNENGIQLTKMFGGFFATIIQHEFDHLQGIIFPKRTLEQQGKLYKASKDEKGEEVFDEIKL